MHLSLREKCGPSGYPRGIHTFDLTDEVIHRLRKRQYLVGQSIGQRMIPRASIGHCIVPLESAHGFIALAAFAIAVAVLTAELHQESPG